MDWIDELFDDVDGRQSLPIDYVSVLWSQIADTSISCDEKRQLEIEVSEPITTERLEQIKLRIEQSRLSANERLPKNQTQTSKELSWLKHQKKKHSD